jgi:hypothetical protein
MRLLAYPRHFGVHRDSLALVRILTPAYVKLSAVHTPRIVADMGTRFFIESVRGGFTPSKRYVFSTHPACTLDREYYFNPPVIIAVSTDPG